ncbi:MAG TPA: hypothetical protein VME22_17715 [Solirubrobacteraceae bacterium]|nr:hypothetical protein [Solirubrobacteraceae bacterium]
MREVPLSGLLARALGDLSDEFVGAGAGRPGMPSPAMWFGLLRAVPLSDDVGQRELPERTRLSKRAVRQLARAATRSGWIEGTGAAGAQGAVRLTGSGRNVAARWAAMTEGVEGRWFERVGVDPEYMRRVLGTVVGQLELELPHYPISYGSADFSVTGGRFRPAQSGRPRVPAHGQDWAPVLRGDGDTVSMLTLTALFSQLLVAFMVDYADARGGALVVAEGLVHGFGTKNTVPTEEVPSVLGINGSGTSGLERHGLVSVQPVAGERPIKVVQLTQRGQRVRDRYATLVREVESDWAARFGVTAMAAVRDAVEATLPALDPTLPDAFIATYVRS